MTEENEPRATTREEWCKTCGVLCRDATRGDGCIRLQRDERQRIAALEAEIRELRDELTSAEVGECEALEHLGRLSDRLGEECDGCDREAWREVRAWRERWAALRETVEEWQTASTMSGGYMLGAVLSRMDALEAERDPAPGGGDAR